MFTSSMTMQYVTKHVQMYNERYSEL